MNNIMFLIFAHYLGDIAHQSDWQSNNKGKFWYIMFCHCMIYCAFVAIALEYIKRPMQWWEFFFILIGHYVVDSIKSRFPKTKKNLWMIYPDQILHLLQLGVIYAF